MCGGVAVGAWEPPIQRPASGGWLLSYAWRCIKVSAAKTAPAGRGVWAQKNPRRRFGTEMLRACMCGTRPLVTRTRRALLLPATSHGAARGAGIFFMGFLARQRGFRCGGWCGGRCCTALVYGPHWVEPASPKLCGVVVWRLRSYGGVSGSGSCRSSPLLGKLCLVCGVPCRPVAVKLYGCRLSAPCSKCCEAWEDPPVYRVMGPGTVTVGQIQTCGSASR